MKSWMFCSMLESLWGLRMFIWVSDGLVLDGLFGVDDSFLVEDSVSAHGALHGIVCFEFGLLAAVSLSADVGDVDELVVVDFHYLDVDYYYKYRFIYLTFYYCSLLIDYHTQISNSTEHINWW